MESGSGSDDDEFVEEEEEVKPQKRKTPVKKSSSSKVDKPKTVAKEKSSSQPKEAPKKFECVLLLKFLFQPSFFFPATVGQQRKRPSLQVRLPMDRKKFPTVPLMRSPACRLFLRGN
jgi:hypothetical protein